MISTTIITKNLMKLRQQFQNHSHDIRICGGAVRDMIRGIEPKDIDLCSDATPEEQIAIYKENNVRYFETGIQHGTITVNLQGEIYEITSLRTESNHDGRHADVAYTRDWMDDLGRRDLTFNAMAMTFDGVLIDPFDGVSDLEQGVVRFVGEPDDRMREDYLRILRWLRFQGRIAPGKPFDTATVEAAKRQANGLQTISRERVWMEMSKIISGADAEHLIGGIYDMGIAPNIDLPIGTIDRLEYARHYTRNPVSLMFALLSIKDEINISVKWKWSSDESSLLYFLIKHDANMRHLNDEEFFAQTKYFIAHDGKPIDWVVELALINGRQDIADNLRQWSVPVFPVNGQDLMSIGVKAGPDMGKMLKAMKAAWAESNYDLSKQHLLDAVNA